jgi:hypothetical protein
MVFCLSLAPGMRVGGMKMLRYEYFVAMLMDVEIVFSEMG